MAWAQRRLSRGGAPAGPAPAAAHEPVAAARPLLKTEQQQEPMNDGLEDNVCLNQLAAPYSGRHVYLHNNSDQLLEYP